jgi:Mor family transcriptional regulator
VNHGSELLSHLAAIVDDEARRGTARLGERTVTRLAYEWGGQKLYIPIDRVRRDRKLYELFNGRNYAELARMFHISEPHARRIVNKERGKLRHGQLVLFPQPAREAL